MIPIFQLSCSIPYNLVRNHIQTKLNIIIIVIICRRPPLNNSHLYFGAEKILLVKKLQILDNRMNLLGKFGIKICFKFMN